MLNHVSWQQYITAAILLTAAWYIYVGLRFHLFKLKTGPINLVPMVASAEVMGGIRTEPGTEPHDPQELIFGSSSPDDISDQTGPAASFLTEAQTLAEATDNKTEFLTLLALLVGKYADDEFDFNALYPQLKLPFYVQADEWPKNPTL